MHRLPLALPLVAAPLVGLLPAPAGAGTPPTAAEARPAAPADPGGSLRELGAALAAERRPAYLATTRDGAVLHIEDRQALSRPTRGLIAALEQEGALTVATGSVPVPITLPAEVRVPPAVMTAGGTSYPEANVGGVRYFIDVGQAQSYCTTGFAVRASNGNTAMTSAGHCGWKTGQPILASTGDAWTSAWTKQVSTVASTTWASDGAVAGDVLSFYSSAAKGHVYQGGTSSRSVAGWANPSLSETSVCFRGATTAGSGSCGPVASTGTVFDVEGHQFPAFCVEGAVPQPGDSGAPMYVKQGTDKVSARGIMSFAQDADQDGDYDNGCGTPIGAVLTATNSTLLTA